MLNPGKACKVSVYLNEDSSDSEGFLHADVLALLRARGIEGATVYQPYAGFGSHAQVHRRGSGSVAGEHLPLLLVFIDTEEKVHSLLPELKALVIDGLIEMHPVEVVQHRMQNGRVDGR